MSYPLEGPRLPNLRFMRNGIVVVLVFFLIYGVLFSFLPTFTSRIIGLMGCAWLLVYFASGQALPLRARIGTVMGAYSAYFIYVGLLTLVFAARDIGLFTNAFLTFGQVFTGSVFVAALTRNEKEPFQAMASLIQAAITIQAICILLYFVSAEFREFTFRFLPETSNLDYREQFVRSRGLTNGGGATLSVVQAIGLLLTVYFLAFRNSLYRVLYLLSSFALILISIVLSGRTGLLILPFLLLFTAYYLLARQRIPKGWAIGALAGPFAIVAVWFAMRYVFFSLFGAGQAEETFEWTINWAIEGYFRNGSVGSRTVDVLISEHLHVPDRPAMFAFGNPNTWELQRVSSDIGLIRRIYGTGIVGTVLGYTAILAMLLNITSLWSSAVRRLLLAALICWLFIIELKEPFLLKFEVLSIVSLLYFASYWSEVRPAKTRASTSQNGKPDADPVHDVDTGRSGEPSRA